MDRNTTIGLVLLGLILTVFSIINQPSKEDYKKKKSAKTEQKLSKETQKDKTKVIDRNTGNDTPEPKKLVQTETKGEIIRIENDKLIVDFNSKGGLVSAVYLKEYKSYNDFSKKKKEPLCLFKDGDNRNQLVFPYKSQTFRSASYKFDVLKKSQNSIVFELSLPDGKIRQAYKLNDSYDLDYDIDTLRITDAGEDAQGTPGAVKPQIGSIMSSIKAKSVVDSETGEIKPVEGNAQSAKLKALLGTLKTNRD